MVLVWQYRELLGNLARKELKVKYKDSVLGFVWSLLNPLLYLVVFSLVFSEVLRVQVPRFGIFLLSGLLAWNLLSAGVSGGTASIVANGSLVQKVWFPREVLPMAAIGAAIVHFVLQLAVLAVALVVFRHAPDWSSMVAFVPAMIALLLLTAALGLLLAAVNVGLRDTQHLLELGLLAWFWLSAIVYPYSLVADRLGDRRVGHAAQPDDPDRHHVPAHPLQPRRFGQRPPPTWAPSWYLRNLGVIVGEPGAPRRSPGPVRAPRGRLRRGDLDGRVVIEIDASARPSAPPRPAALGQGAAHPVRPHRVGGLRRPRRRVARRARGRDGGVARATTVRASPPS
jgi:ABC-2 type transport system permease protein